MKTSNCLTAFLIMLSIGASQDTYAYSTLISGYSLVAYDSLNDNFFVGESNSNVAELNRAGSVIGTIALPSAIASNYGSLAGFDPISRTMIFGSSAGFDDYTQEVDLNGNIIKTYTFTSVNGNNNAAVGGMVVNSSGNRDYYVGSSDPFSIVEMPLANVHDGNILPSEISQKSPVPSIIFAAGFTIDPATGNFLFGSGYKGVIYETNLNGSVVNKYDLTALGFGPAYYNSFGYFIGRLVITNDGSLLIGESDTNRNSGIFEFSNAEWKSYLVVPQEPPQVPLPASLWLFISGAGALLTMAGRRQKAEGRRQNDRQINSLVASSAQQIMKDPHWLVCAVP